MELRKVYLESLGCAKNLVDSEVIAGYLISNGFLLTTAKEEATFIIVNTCAFIADAIREARETIAALIPLKKEGICQKIIVTGCLLQRLRNKDISKDDPLREVDLFINSADIPKIAELLLSDDGSTTKYHYRNPAKASFLLDHNTPRILSTPSHMAYLKIAEGCSNHCTFCTIPVIKGPFHSREPDSIIAEASNLAEGGVKELNLIAQDTSFYGRDLKANIDLSILLKNLASIDGIEWIRLLYCHPDHFSDGLINTILEEEKVCSYLDIPLQHISDHILKKMGRKKNGSQLKELLHILRRSIPDLRLRTTLMVGFPGETDRDFQLLLDFISEMEFEHLGVFKYSDEEGTKAYYLSDKVDAGKKEERYHTLLSTQAHISLKKYRTLIGSDVTVLIDGIDRETALPVGRTFFQAPESDGMVFISKGTVDIGEMVTARIIDASEYDLFATLETE